MKHYFALFLTLSVSLIMTACNSTETTATEQGQNSKINKELLVDASCGQCKFGLSGKGCDLAVRINGKAYFVDGTGIDGHGDAHAKDGFCNAILKAKVQGHVHNGRFKVLTFDLVSDDSK